MNFSELLLISVVALVVFGPKRLPQLAQDIGRWLARAKRFIASVKFELDHPIREKQLQENIAKAKAAECQQSIAPVEPLVPHE